MTKHRNCVYRDKHGTWWARVNGARKTGNTERHAYRLYQEMLDDIERQALTSQELAGQIEIIVLRGPPGCGKTTWANAYIAEHPRYKRINRDSLRQMFDFGVYSRTNEQFIRAMRRKLIRECLDAGRPVIVDDTNLHQRDLWDIRDEAHIHSRTSEFGFCPVPIRVVDIVATFEECIARDAQRQHPIGVDRIREMYRQWQALRGEIDD